MRNKRVLIFYFGTFVCVVRYINNLLYGTFEKKANFIHYIKGGMAMNGVNTRSE